MTAPIKSLEREIHVFLASPEDLDNQDSIHACEALLSSNELWQLRRFVFERDRQLYRVAHALVRTTLSRYANVPPRDFRFRENQYGRPEIAYPSGLPLRFNLSHTPGLTACLVNLTMDAGVDVQQKTTLSDFRGVAEYSFSESENSALFSLDEADRYDRFFEYWTLKEAYIKARGMGLQIPLSEFSFDLKKGEPVRVSFELDDVAEHWQFSQGRPTAEHHLAVAVKRFKKPDLAIRVEWADPIAK